MSDPVFGDRELEFPQDVHFRIIALGTPEAAQAVRAVAEDLGVADQLQVGNSSAGGKYQSYNLSIVASSKEDMERVDAGFRCLECVKMVL